MTFIAPLVAAVGSALAPAAGAAAAGGAAAAATGAAASGFSVLSVLAGGASLLGALGTLGAADAQADGLQQQAGQEDLDADRENNLGMQRRTAMKRELFSVLGENQVRAAAAGIDIGSGVTEDMNASVETAAAQELSIDRGDQEYRAAQRRARASGLRSQATSVRRAGALTAAGQGLQSGLTAFSRG